MSDPKKNTWDDADFAAVVERHEQLDAEAEKIMAIARGEVSAIREKQKKLKKEAADDLRIPRKVLNPTLKIRKLERKIDETAKSIDRDDVELFEDAIGQFSFLKPTAKERGKTGAQIAASRAAEAAKANQEAEQEEGEKVLDDLVGGSVH